MFETLLFLATLGLTALLGTMAAYFALRAYKRVREGSLLLTALGFGLISSATVLGAIGCVWLNMYDVTVHVAQSTTVAAGLLAIIYSISHVRGPTASITQHQATQQRIDRRRRHAYSKQTIMEN